MEGTIVELTKVIKDHLAENPSRTNEPRFSGLFASHASGSRKRTAAVVSLSESSEVAGGELSMPSLPQSSASTNDAFVPNLLQRFSKECGNEFLKSCASDMAGMRPRTHLSEQLVRFVCVYTVAVLNQCLHRQHDTRKSLRSAPSW